MNKPVNLEIAKILKEKGFKESTEANWWILTKDHSDNYMNRLPVDESKIFFAKDSCELESKIQIDENTEHDVFHFLRAPTIADVVMWLYEKHGIWIGVELTDNTREFYFQPTIWTSKDREYHDEDMIDQAISICKWKEWRFNSPTEAYEAAIKHTLENLI